MDRRSIITAPREPVIGERLAPDRSGGSVGAPQVGLFLGQQSEQRLPLRRIRLIHQLAAAARDVQTSDDDTLARDRRPAFRSGSARRQIP
jgi:hypothetical protein